jgi:hypoxanthine phosphoribosyltransferase
MREVSYNDKIFEMFISQDQLQNIVSRLADEINDAYVSSDAPVVLISILDGSFIFMADLVRKIRIPVSIQFVKLQSYEDTTSRGEVAQLLKLQSSLTGKHVVVVEDIIDTGLTLEVFQEELNKKNPLSVKICTLLSKPEVHNDIIDIHFVGQEIGPDFVIGYGLDINGEGRQLPHIYRLKVD